MVKLLPLILAYLLPIAACSTVRHAKVRIENRSSWTLSAVRVRHTYGSIFSQRNSESQTWTNIPPGTSTDASLIVEYLTGDPNADWWQVGFTVLGEPMIDASNAGNIAYRQTNPDNFQSWVSQISENELTNGIITSFQSIPFSVDFIKRALKMGAGPAGNALEAIFQVSKVVVELLQPGYAATSGLVGYKQCALFGSDADKVVSIRIWDSGNGVQLSPKSSSNCDTVWKLRTLPWEVTF